MMHLRTVMRARIGRGPPLLSAWRGLQPYPGDIAQSLHSLRTAGISNEDSDVDDRDMTLKDTGLQNYKRLAEGQSIQMALTHHDLMMSHDVAIPS